jgi:hypothetical protein
LPVLEDTTVDVKSIFEDVFKDSSAPYRIKELPDNLYKSEPDTDMKDILQAIENIEHKSADLKRGTGLQDHLSVESLEKLKSGLGEPDLLLVPAEFSLKEINFSVMGKATVRLYDLHTGNLIFQNKENVNVGPGGVVRSGGLLQAIGAGTKVSPDLIGVAEDCTYLLAAQAFETINKEVFNINTPVSE